jgi:hypothetical protein
MLLTAALLSAALHLRRATPRAAPVSQVLWSDVRLSGRMIA